MSNELSSIPDAELKGSCKAVTKMIKMRTNGKKYSITIKFFRSGIKKYVCDTW
jgi:hypothetical protein